MTDKEHRKLKGPLDGLRVIDWTMWQFGPVSTMMLADMGAEVIKIESLDGDHGRQGSGDSSPFLGTSRNRLGLSKYSACNSNQKAIASKA